MPQVVFPVSFEDVSAWHDHLALAVFESLGDTTVVDRALNLSDLVFGILKELMPVVRHLLGQILADH